MIYTVSEMAMEGDETIDARLQMFRDQREKLLAQMAELQQTLDVVDYKCWYYETARAAGSEEVLKDLSEEDLPEKFRPVLDYLRSQK